MTERKDKSAKKSVLTERMNVDSEEFKGLQSLILQKSREQTQEQRKYNELYSLQIQMEDYLKSDDGIEIKLAGEFLKSFLSVLDIRQNRFAEYIGLRPSNLNKLIKGERPINSELALILGKIFNLNPMIWLKIQSKNELERLSKEKNKQLEKYSLNDLMNKNVA